MFRVAVIQNGIEMQHSGYVDAIQRYRKFARIGREKADFTRFSGVNIRDLFSQGSNYLMDFDALILGTNATSDDDVYDVLRESGCKSILQSFIASGKGVLICSQKKYQSVDEGESTEHKIIIDARNDDFIRILENTGKGELYYRTENTVLHNKTKKRISGFLPQKYEYIIDERPSAESSRDGSVELISVDRCTINQKCLMSIPNIITNELLHYHCTNNSFQTHFYRDIILPVYSSSYQSIVIDQRDGSNRDVLMVSVPQKNERIVISTMALDWAGHDELLENIINYLTRGIPHTAFVHKGNYDNDEMKILTLDAELSKVGYAEYNASNDFLEHANWHSLVVFSPDYSEQDVMSAWQQIKQYNPFTKAFHYRKISDELVLVKYSNNTYIEQQKMDVLSWLNSKRGKKLWANSLWKTFDVAKLLFSMGSKQYMAIINQIVEAILDKDDNGKAHYRKDGSYDGVLAPSCGVMELLHWTGKTEYSITRDYLVDRFNNSDNIHNKMFILRTFYHCSDQALETMISDFQISDNASFNDMIDLDLCLVAEIAIILYMRQDANKSTNKQRLIDSLTELCNRQIQSGKWDSLSNTATILSFLLEYFEDVKRILKTSQDQELLNTIRIKIDRGVAAIKASYSSTECNWENNIVTTANSMLVLYRYDELSGYRSKDFLKQFIDESQVASNYNSLNIALNTLDRAIDDSNKAHNDLYESKERIKRLETREERSQKRLYVVSSIAGFSLFGLVSAFIWLALKAPKALKDISSEIFMWIPIAIGMAITPVVMFLIKKVSTFKDQMPQSKQRRRKQQ